MSWAKFVCLLRSRSLFTWRRRFLWPTGQSFAGYCEYLNEQLLINFYIHRSRKHNHAQFPNISRTQSPVNSGPTLRAVQYWASASVVLTGVGGCCWSYAVCLHNWIPIACQASFSPLRKTHCSITLSGMCRYVYKLNNYLVGNCVIAHDNKRHDWA